MSTPTDAADNEPDRPGTHDTQPLPRPAPADVPPRGDEAGGDRTGPDQPAADEPAATQPTATQPTADEPTADPTADQPTADQPTRAQPTARPVRPVTPQPAGAQPAHEAQPAAEPVQPIPAKRPVAAPPVLVPALVVAAVVGLIGVVGVHDALVRADLLVRGPTWVGAAIEQTNGSGSAIWMSVAGIAVALLGLWLIVLAAKPRRAHGLQVQGDTGIWLDFRAVARIANSVATDTDGVAEARTRAGRRRVVVDAVLRPETTADPGELSRRIKALVVERLKPLVRPPTVRVHLREPAGADVRRAGMDPNADGHANGGQR